MKYVVKWHPKERPEHVVTCDGDYPNPSQAMDFACAVLANHPIDVWVESVSRGDKIADAARIREHCRTRGLYPQSN